MGSLKISGTVVVEGDNANTFLTNIASLDANTEQVFVTAVRAQDHKFQILDSTGTSFDTFYGANTDPAGA